MTPSPCAAGQARLTSSLMSRSLCAREGHELDARASPLRALTGRGIVTSGGAPERRRLMRFHTSFSLPKVVPADAVLVHGSVRPSGRQRGFQAWMSRPDAPGLVVCDCC